MRQARAATRKCENRMLGGVASILAIIEASVAELKHASPGAGIDASITNKRK